MDIDVFILIGGKSSRLGTDKALVEIRGKTLAERSAKTIETALCPNRINFVSRSEDQFNTDLFSKLGYQVIADLRPGFGAWSGIHTAVADAQSDWIFLSACDNPMVSPEFLKLLADSIVDGDDAVAVRQPDGRLQPLFAFYRARPTLAVVEKILATNERLPPLTTIFDSLKTRILNPDEYDHLENADKFFLNINTAADLSAIRNLYAENAMDAENIRFN